jgi:diguanylate cyclase (GGDEF)-like protein/PAS domain S-box-containing protein
VTTLAGREHAAAPIAPGLNGLFRPEGLLEATPECLVVAAADGRIVFANQRLEALAGYGRGELVDRSVGNLIAAAEPLLQAAAGRLEGTCRTKDGSELPVEVHLGSVDGPNGRYLVVTLRDVSDLRAALAARFESESKYLSLVEGIPAITYVDPIDENSESIYVSPQVKNLLGISQEDWLTNPYCWRDHVHPDDIDRAWAEYEEAYTNRTSLTHEYRMVHRDGTVLWVSEQAFIISDEAGEPWLIQGVIFDITERKRAEEQVAFLAYHDKLTGLPNRILFEEMLELSLARARRHGLGVGVIYLDLDNFKLVNDSLGHHAGDELLAQLAERLRGCTRETDLVARHGGDEFLLLLSDLENTPGPLAGLDPELVVAESVASRVHEALQRPFDLSGTPFTASASIGISLFPRDAQDGKSLLRNADAAMYQSKKVGPAGYLVFSAADEDPVHRLSLTNRLRRAVEEQQWVLHYQPVFELPSRTVRGVEALVRWQEPSGGLVAPGEFIPLAEELGLIEAIGDWVVGELARQHARWRESGIDLEIGFNLSPRELWSVHLPDRLLGRLRAEGVEPGSVVVEITESMAMTEPERTQRILTEMHAWGLTLAIDDFGTGYSSLSRLKHLPVDVLKIDRSFVSHVDTDPDNASMVRAMIDLAANLGMAAAAEGIETRGELDFLVERGCPLGQGFFLGRPVPAGEISALLSAPRPA